MKNANYQNLTRRIVDFKKLNDALLHLLVTKYPDGFGDSDIVSFRNQYNETIECVEVKTDDTIYLVKVSKRLVVAMEDYEEGDEEINFDMDSSED